MVKKIDKYLHLFLPCEQVKYLHLSLTYIDTFAKPLYPCQKNKLPYWIDFLNDFLLSN